MDRTSTAAAGSMAPCISWDRGTGNVTAEKLILSHIQHRTATDYIRFSIFLQMDVFHFFFCFSERQSTGQKSDYSSYCSSKRIKPCSWKVIHIIGSTVLCLLEKPVTFLQKSLCCVCPVPAAEIWNKLILIIWELLWPELL